MKNFKIEFYSTNALSKKKMRGLIFHEIKAAFGWGSEINKLDVSCINYYHTHYRLFKIMQRDLPYTLTINYHQPEEHVVINPVIGGNGFSINKYTSLNKTITFRYPTEELVEAEVNVIESKRQVLEQIRRELKTKCLKKLK